MSLPVITLEGASSAEAQDASRRAAEIIRAGQLAILPTETIYAVFGVATSSAVRERFAGLGPDLEPGIAAQAGGFTWHAADVPALTKAGMPALSAPVHRRLIEQLLPGPVQFLIEWSEEELVAAHAALGVPPTLFRVEQSSERAAFSVRVPEHALAQAVAAQTHEPLVARGLPPKFPGGGASLTPALNHPVWTALGQGAAPVALAVDAGPTRCGRASTVVRLTQAGGYRIVRTGAVESARIDAAATRLMLFVCTGNTCRSPMAAALAKAELDAATLRKLPPPVGYRAESAGVAAASGSPATPEGIAALRQLGIAPAPHRARQLTPELIAAAEQIFTMTRAHARAVAQLAPEATHKIAPLDPEEDVADPIGQSQRVYSETAQRLRTLIRRRLAELGVLTVSTSGSHSA